MQIARLNGAEKVFAVDTIPSRLKLAKKFAADAVFNAHECDPAVEIKNAINKKRVDVAIEISGAYSGLQVAIRSVQVTRLVVAARYYSG